MSNHNQTDNFYKAFALFIDAMRPYIVSLLMSEFGDRWAAEFVKVLTPDQVDKWNMGLRSGSAPETLIDYHHLKSFAIKNKHLLKEDFGKKFGDAPNWFGEIAQVRHDVAHFKAIDKDEATKAWIHLRTIARLLQMNELAAELEKLQNAEKTIDKTESPQAKTILLSDGHLPAWFGVVQPHYDIRQGRLDESVFAANLAEVALGNGRDIYKDARTFFDKTYFTAGLTSVAKTVIQGLNGKEDAENRVISLQTGFGGGKTHTLISLYHLCTAGKKIAQINAAQTLLKQTGLPEFDTANIAVFTNTTNDPANGRMTSDGVHIQTIWGELAYQLGGKESYEIVRKNDEQLISPAGIFKQVLTMCKPALILIDELADYCVKAAARKAGNSSLADQTISFMQEFTQAVSETNHCVAIITLPASPQEVGNTPEAQAILNSLQKRVSRVGADTQPVAEDEVYEVIRRRLFEEIGDASIIESVANRYIALYQQYHKELPSNATKSEYKQKIIKSYPFHPELIDIFRVRWASNHDFQRTRGVLRLLAAIVSDLWKRQQSLPDSNLLIHSGNINLANIDALSGQIKKLYGNGYDAVISADVSGGTSNAFKIDSNKKEYGDLYLTQSIASVILVNSFGSDGTNKGVSVPDIKLHLLRPNSFNHNSINGALDELESAAYYLYYAQTGGSGKRYWFHTKPNINILINHAKADIKHEAIEAEVLKRLKEKTHNRITHFNVLVDAAEDIPEQTKPTLIFLHPKYSSNLSEISGKTKPIIEKIATKKGNSERIYRNTLLFLVCSEIGLSKLQSDIREYLACQKISLEYNSQLEREQRDEIKRRADDASQKSDISIVTAYSIVVKHSVKKGIQKLNLVQFKDTIESQINHHLIAALKEEEWLLESVGLGTLKSNQLLPTLEEAIKVKDIYEAFIRFDDKPMITGVEAISKSLLRYCINGAFCIAAGDGKHFTKYFLSEDVPFFDVTDVTYWLVDKTLKTKVEEEKQTNNFSPSNNPAKVDEPEIGGNPNIPPIDNNSPKIFKSVCISGKIPLENYTQIFNSFIMPLAQNNIEIEIRIKGKSTTAKPLTETSQVYQIIKESAKQLGLKIEEE